MAAAIIGPTALGAPIARGVLDTRDQNDTISRAVRGNSERFPLGLALVELRHERAGVDEIERALNEGGLRGIMYHPGATSLGEQLYPHLEVCATKGEGLCLLHADPQITARYARRFPNLTFLVWASDLEDAVELCKPLENVWFEVVQKPIGRSSWDYSELVKRLGSERILFGSDVPYYDYRVLQNSIESSDLDENTKDRIAYGNGVNLIQKFCPDWRLNQEPPQPPQVYDDEELWAAKNDRFIT